MTQVAYISVLLHSWSSLEPEDTLRLLEDYIPFLLNCYLISGPLVF